ncbi:MAG TPA: hypothetical protein VJN88_02680 [Ktedonobacterales bacterium]|nr:hypothetical protein [Ktedonobacterales bacterium]
MDQDTSEDQHTRARLVGLYAGLSQAQRDAIGELLRAVEDADPPDTEQPVVAVSAESLAEWHLRLGLTHPDALARALRMPAAIIALGLAAPDDADWSRPGLQA